ncbi:hypothetical protein POVCU1_004270 [Plasmodium ovale curtisi]|uniref:Uncharacterized protein n=1 Tax=Plasmodium ovale curtisi TaxID=864141 RepID=A0A1A8VN15_PLAOA|nr:hypothetical protein POVCU1_004270 [Plasmodium ovale curtisi]
MQRCRKALYSKSKMGKLVSSGIRESSSCNYKEGIATLLHSGTRHITILIAQGKSHKAVVRKERKKERKNE